MPSHWQNFLRNLGEWRGSFPSIAADGSLGESSPSLLTLEREYEDRLVRFALRRGGGEPRPAVEQLYSSRGSQVVFFASGAFSKGSLQVAVNEIDAIPSSGLATARDGLGGQAQGQSQGCSGAGDAQKVGLLFIGGKCVPCHALIGSG